MDIYQLLANVQDATEGTPDYQRVIMLVSQNKHIFSPRVNPVDSIDRIVSEAKEWQSLQFIEPNEVALSLQTGYTTATLTYQSTSIHEAVAEAIRRKTQLPSDNPYRESIKQEGGSLARNQLDTSSKLKTKKTIIELYLKAKLHLDGMEGHISQLKL